MLIVIDRKGMAHVKKNLTTVETNISLGYSFSFGTKKATEYFNHIFSFNSTKLRYMYKFRLSIRHSQTLCI